MQGQNHLRTQFSSNKNKVADEACPTLLKEGRKLLCGMDKVCQRSRAAFWSWKLGILVGIPSWKSGIVRGQVPEAGGY